MQDKIASITPYVIPADTRPDPWWSRKPYMLVRVETSDGIVGWGECHHLNFREGALVAMIHAAAATLIGRPAHDIRSLQHDAFFAFGQQRPGLEVYSAIAGIELALWDILGKRFNTPVYELTGGALQDSVAVYANIYSPRPQKAADFAEMAARQVESGHSAIKLYPFSANTSIAEGVAILEAVRDAVGPKIALAVDLWRQADPARALALAKAMEPFDLIWIEDPFAPTDAQTLRYVREAIRQPLLTGETLATRRDFAPIFEARAVDIVNPDICQTGLLELQAIAAMAETFCVKLSPHNSNSMALGTAAAVHASLGIANVGLVEYFPLFETALDDVCEGRLPVRNGSIAKPFNPGLGLTFDELHMERYRV